MLDFQIPRITTESVEDNRGSFTVEPLDRGFGYTFGNSLRRVLLSSLAGAAVTSVQVRPEGQLEIRAERTNGTWVLTQPLAYPAEPAVVESLLVVLERLTPATYITRRELASRPKAEEEYGFTSPQATINLWRGNYHSILLIGARTAPVVLWETARQRAM